MRVLALFSRARNKGSPVLMQSLEVQIIVQRTYGRFDYSHSARVSVQTYLPNASNASRPYNMRFASVR